MPSGRKNIIPDLQSSLLCDDVRQERNGKFILIGLFDMISFAEFPSTFQRFCIVNRWCCGEGEFKQQNRLINPDGKALLVAGKEVLVALANNESTATSIEFFLNVKLELAGTYWIEVILDGTLKMRYPLRARRAQGQEAT